MQDVAAWQAQVLRLEAEGRLTRTFRRLDPGQQWAVVAAVVAEAAEHGPRGLQVKRVATRARVSVGSLYQYFPRRAGMLDVAVEVASGFLTASLDGYSPVLAQLPLRDGLSAYLAGGVEWSAGNTELLDLFVQAAYAGLPGYAETLVRPVATAMQRMLRALLETARDRGELRPDLDLETTLRLIQVFTIAVGDGELVPFLNDYYLLHDPEHPPARIREASVDFIIQAIGRETP